jgi:DNA repair photolyase
MFSMNKLQLPLFAPPEPPATRAPVATANQVEYVPMMCKSILNWVDGTHVADTFSVNPYRGCEVGCAYCYARYTHEFLELRDWEAFERRVFVKIDAPAALTRELKRKDVLAHGVTIGTATDPYQPAEKHFGVTKKLLEGLLAVPARKIPITIITKSNLIRRDAALLERLAERHDVTVCFSCITVEVELLRVLERRAPHPDARFRAMKALTERGIRCGTLMMPILPGITDAVEQLREVVRRARAAGSAFVHAGPLWLTDSSRKRFFPWLAEHAPELYQRYTSAMGKRMYVREEYRAMLRGRIERVLGEYGYGKGEAGDPLSAAEGAV